jgi:hypothetical protein
MSDDGYDDGVLLDISPRVQYWTEVQTPIITSNTPSTISVPINTASIWGLRERIAIKGRWYDVIPVGKLARNRNSSDGYFRVIYIQINFETGEYYLGKANRPKWSELRRYQGSGLRFVSKLNKHEKHFSRYFIAQCDSAEETEALESALVDEELLKDKKCLNLVAGGAGTSTHPSKEERNEKIRLHMLNNPQQYQGMLEGSKKAFQSGDTPALRARSRRIKEVLSQEKYKKMRSDQIKKWMRENPEAYAEARRKSTEAIRTAEVQKKRVQSQKEWKKENPEKYEAWENKRKKALSTPESKAKRNASIAEWKKNNPIQAEENLRKSVRAANAKRSKAVNMIELKTGKILKRFKSQHDAARWLVKQGIAKNEKCVASINGVCVGRPTRAGRPRKSAYGFGWCYAPSEQIGYMNDR